MTNLWFNIRFGTYHWQLGPEGMTLKQNPFQIRQRSSDPNWTRFEIYRFFGQ